MVRQKNHDIVASSVVCPISHLPPRPGSCFEREDRLCESRADSELAAGYEKQEGQDGGSSGNQISSCRDNIHGDSHGNSHGDSHGDSHVDTNFKTNSGFLNMKHMATFPC